SQASHDIIGLHDEGIDGRPLLVKVMQGGRRLPPGCVTLPQICDHAQSEMAKLPKRLLSVDSAQPSYCVELSLGLQVEIDRLRRDLQSIG
ncbi:MAG: nicotinate phosphoribosyltransferase, partial [Planctomycetota bacterium]|nr:nicotinate phosphoribosyltransferase [Planctomycetota bacterium]